MFGPVIAGHFQGHWAGRARGAHDTSSRSDGHYYAARRDAALVELLRRIMHIGEHAAPGVLVKVLRLPVAPPAPFRVQSEPVLDNRRRAMR